MAKKLLIRMTAFATVMAMVVLGAGVAWADNVQNDVTAGGSDTITAGASTSISYRIVATGGDSQNGCNAADGSAATLTITAPAGVTVSPSSLTFTVCGNPGEQSVTFGSSSVGNHSITHAITDSGPGTYTNQANWTLKVNAATPADPCDTATVPAAPEFTAGSPNGDNGWFKATVPASVPSAAATSTTSGAAISYSTDGTTFSSTVPTLGEGTTTVTAKASAATCATKSSTTARTFKIDTIAPSITDGGATTSPNTNGWYKRAVTNTFNASDTGGSGLADCTASFTKSSGTSEEGSAVKIASGGCSDLAGNTNSGIDSAAFQIDMTAPGDFQFSSNPTNYYFGQTPPAAPTCTADDALSLVTQAGCTVSAYATTVGTHTLTASASDNAGNEGTAQSASYSVLAWTLKGFYSPVDLGGVVNVAKAGSTVPLKFEIFAGSTELTDTSAIDTFTIARATCGSAYGSEDAIEQYSTGGTSLRYDATGGQFIQNWKVPTGANICYRVTMTADDGSATSALFRSK